MWILHSHDVIRLDMYRKSHHGDVIVSCFRGSASPPADSTMNYVTVCFEKYSLERLDLLTGKVGTRGDSRPLLNIRRDP